MYNKKYNKYIKEAITNHFLPPPQFFQRRTRYYAAGEIL